MIEYVFAKEAEILRFYKSFYMHDEVLEKINRVQHAISFRSV
jgi:hypothetical protein